MQPANFKKPISFSSFESELIGERKKSVEDFALNAGRKREIASVEDVKKQKENFEKSKERVEEQSEEEKKKEKDERDLINKIMGNKFGMSNKGEESEQDKQEEEKWV